MITVGAGVRALTQLDDADVSLGPLVMGDLTVHESMGEQLALLRERFASWAGAEVDFSGYYSVEPGSSLSLPADDAQPASAPMGAPATSQAAASTAATAWHWLPWPWPSGLDPFVFMAHSSSQDEITMVVDGVVRPVTDQAVGSWLRQRFELSLAQRALEHPLVVLTCTENATREAVADQVGRLVWFTDGMTRVRAQPVAGGGRVILEVYAAGVGRERRGGRLRSVYPRGSAGDRVRWAYRDRFGAQAAHWLVECAADAGSPAPSHARAQVFGHGRVRGLSYFDQRDQASRAGVLGSSVLGSTHVAWSSNPAYRPGVPVDSGDGSGTARPWNARELGELPFDPDTAVIVLTYFLAGRFAVYAQQEDISYWETPQAFGARLHQDLTTATANEVGVDITARTPARVVLLTDFEAVPEAVRAQVAHALNGPDLITVNTPTTLFLDDTPGTVNARTRIALLPTATGAFAPEWTSTTPDGLSTRLPGETSDHRSSPTQDDKKRGGLPQTLAPNQGWPGANKQVSLMAMDGAFSETSSLPNSPSDPGQDPQPADSGADLPTRNEDTAPAVDYRLIHEWDRDLIVPCEPDEILWHFSGTRDPSAIMRNGFPARNVGFIENLVDYTTYYANDCQFISTTRDVELGHTNAAYQYRRFRFKIDSARNHSRGVDVEATLKSQFGDLEVEGEVAFTGRIDSQAVASVYDRELDRTGILNPMTQEIEWRTGDWQNRSGSDEFFFGQLVRIPLSNFRAASSPMSNRELADFTTAVAHAALQGPTVVHIRVSGGPDNRTSGLVTARAQTDGTTEADRIRGAIQSALAPANRERVSIRINLPPPGHAAATIRVSLEPGPIQLSQHLARQLGFLFYEGAEITDSVEEQVNTIVGSLRSKGVSPGALNDDFMRETHVGLVQYIHRSVQLNLMRRPFANSLLRMLNPNAILYTEY